MIVIIVVKDNYYSVQVMILFDISTFLLSDI